MQTVKVNVSELSGAALDWCVAKCDTSSCWILDLESFLPNHSLGRMNYSTDWAQGGPIIDREGIFFSPLPDMGLRAFQFKEGEYRNIIDCLPYREHLTRLIVGMRCYVASKLGDIVEVPEELLK